jgi:oligoribonuclease
MTGLDIDNDVLLSIACFVTDYDLNLLDEQGFEVVIHRDQEVMDRMDEWCTKTHKASGLTEDVLASTVTPDEAAEKFLEYVKEHVPQPRRALLAGNTVHQDRAFLRKHPFSEVIEYLHHRILDVSTIKEAARRWASKELIKNTPRKRGLHNARQDVLESIEEAKYYRDIFFKKAESPKE